MRWPNLLARFSGWFADAIALGDYALASRFATIALHVRAAEHAPESVHVLLDELDQGELARRDARVLFPEPLPPLCDLADDFEEMFAELGRWGRAEGDTCGEAAVAYSLGEEPAPVPKRFGKPGSAEDSVQPASERGQGYPQNGAHLPKLEDVQAQLSPFVLAHVRLRTPKHLGDLNLGETGLEPPFLQDGIQFGALCCRASLSHGH